MASSCRDSSSFGQNSRVLFGRNLFRRRATLPCNSLTTNPAHGCNLRRVWNALMLLAFMDLSLLRRTARAIALTGSWWAGMDSNQLCSPHRDQIYSLTQHRQTPHALSRAPQYGRIVDHRSHANRLLSTTQFEQVSDALSNPRG